MAMAMAGGTQARAGGMLASMLLAVALVVACSAQDSLYVHLNEDENVVVFKAEESLNLGKWGRGKVFDHPVTTGYDSSSKLVAKAQGLYYRSGTDLASYQESFTVLFVDADSGRYTGTSFSFGGVWLDEDNYVKDFYILGGSGHLRGIKGNVLLTDLSNSVEDSWLLTVEEPAESANLFRSFLATHVFKLPANPVA